jgi:diacylglycerol kinase (ATP)
MFILNKLIHATRWSLAGLRYVFHHEIAFKLELFVAVILIPLAFVLADTLNQLLWLVFSIWLVLIIELINSAIETVVNRIGTEQHELSMRAKDIGSAAVFMGILFALLVWGSFLLQQLAV